MSLTPEQLLKQTDESPTGYFMDLKSDVSGAIRHRLKDLEKDTSWLCEKLGFDESFISDVLVGDIKLNLHQVSRIYWALGVKPKLVFDTGDDI